MACLAVGLSSLTVYGQGIAVTGVGPVNRSMAGAGTAAPLEAIGALHWNPGSIGALEHSQASFGLELINVDINLSSNIGGVGATTQGDAGFAPIPSIGWVHHIEDTPVSIGLGIYAIAGFKNNLPNDTSNLLLAAGPAYADAEILQLAPTVSYQVSDRLAIGVAPTVTTATVTLDPLGPSVVTPATLPGSGNRMHWGGGFQVGAYFTPNPCWNWGFTYKSPQWLEDLRFFAPGGTVTFDLDYPAIISMGTAYSGFRNTLLAFDARYFDYENTDGFRELGFSSVFALAFGAQYQPRERLFLRAGYNFNAIPINNDDVFTNVVSPLIQQHNVAAGATVRLARLTDLNLAYVYLVNSSKTGPLPAPPFGPTDTLTNEIEGHSALLGVTVRY